MISLGLWAAAMTGGVRLVLADLEQLLAIGLVLGVALVPVCGQLGDAQIKNLVDRVNNLMGGGGGGGNIQVDTTQRQVPGNTNARFVISASAGLRALPPPGTEVMIEVTGNGSWQQQHLSFYISVNDGAQFIGCEACIHGTGSGLTAGQSFSWTARATITVKSVVPSVLQLHLSGAITPTYDPAANGGNGGNFCYANNSVPFESHANQGIPWNQAALNALTIYAAWRAAAAGQLLTSDRTKISYYGG
jgi:hypothetical protein